MHACFGYLFLLSVLFYVGCVAGLCFFNVFVDFYMVLGVLFDFTRWFCFQRFCTP